MTTGGVADSFEEFYAAHFQPLLLQLYAYTTDLGQAQDAVQEAFTRAFLRWDRLSRDGPSPDRVALARALATLPESQRRAVVLFHVADLSITEIADQEGVAEGTVKSLLHRGEIRSAGDAVEARVADFAGDGLPDNLAQKQWRRYAWRDGRFRQTGGPSAFPANPRITDLAVTGADLELTPAGDERAAGTLRLTVRNNGPQPAAPMLRVVLPKPFDVGVLPAGCTRSAFSTGTTYICLLSSVAVGRTKLVELPVSVPLGQVGSGVAGRYQAQVSSPADPNQMPYPEPAGKKADNSIERDLIVT